MRRRRGRRRRRRRIKRQHLRKLGERRLQEGFKGFRRLQKRETSGWIQMEWKMKLKSRIGLVLRSTKRKIGEVVIGNVEFARRRILWGTAGFGRDSATRAWR